MDIIERLSAEELAELRQWKPHIYILYSLMNVGMVLGLTYLAVSVDHWLAFGICVLLIGTIYVSFSNAAHECSHDLISPWRRANRFFGAFWMTPLLINFTVHKNYHLKHHSHTTREGDPEFNFEYDGFGSIKNYLWSLFKWITIYDPLHLLNWKHSYRSLRGQLTDLLTSDRKIKDARVDTIILFTWMATMLLLTFFWPKPILVGYWIPVCCVTPMVAYITAVPEHYDVQYGENALANTRTIETHPWLSLIFWHFNYHTAHHYNPSIPFYSLRLLHEKIGSKVAHKEKSYIGFHIKTIKKILQKSRSISV